MHPRILEIRTETERATGSVGSESPWHGHRFQADCPNHLRMYFKNVLNITRNIDLMNKDTNRPFSRREWIDTIYQMHERVHGVEPDVVDAIDRADALMDIQKSITSEDMVRNTFRKPQVWSALHTWS